MATLCMSSSSPVKLHPISPFINSSFPANPKLLLSFPRRRSFFHHFTAVNYVPESLKLRARVSLFPFLFTKSEDTESLKQELLEAIAPLDRGAEATPEDQKLIDQIASKLEVANKVKEPLKSSLLNGKWELLYTTSQSILQTKFIIVAEAQILESQWKNLPGYQCRYIEGSEYRNMAIFQSAIVLLRLRNLVKLDLFAIQGLNLLAGVLVLHLRVLHTHARSSGHCQFSSS
ncbi:uncharacterized protein LOC107023427 isoform X3 [Solanum pennellii]|uniref:Uncharacterized protein LOC107023427 isoform X3 n=1 Tax=Solanum pennellii TaxID=28526 RepID=A0ABM1VE29_SOLPN|nr:uncharacterized protein LOC107023427 isoform X3 [Solanum pennellii]